MNQQLGKKISTLAKIASILFQGASMLSPETVKLIVELKVGVKV